jgi:hypothetical protein
MPKRGSHYRNMPRGMHRLSSNIKPDSKAVDLDDLAISGSRAHRRFAKREIARLEKERVRNARR